MKKFLAVLVLGLLACDVGFAGCIEGNCKNGQGTYTTAKGSKYVGEFKDSKPHGQGTLTFEHGFKYVGEFKKGVAHGQGTMTYPDGSKYVGEFKDTIFHGQGTLTMADGTVMKGIWKNGDFVKELKSEAANYVFKNTLYEDSDIVKKKDPTGFQNLIFVEEKKIKAWDRREETSSGWKKSEFKVFIFNTTFEKGHDILIRVNAEFKTKKKAEKQGLKYGKRVGQLPNFLRKNLKIITIHKGKKRWAGSSDGIMIHTGYFVGDTGNNQGKRTNAANYIGEVMLHETAHTSLDFNWSGSIIKSEWIVAQKADKKFISKFAADDSVREDIAETVVMWVAVRCKADRISKSNYKKILKAIPNRIKYFDEQNYDTYPLVCKK